MSVIEPILRRLPPKVVIPALLAALALLGSHAIADWRNGNASVLADVAAATGRIATLEHNDTVQSTQMIEVLRRLEKLDARSERAERAQLEALKFWYERVPGGEAKARDMSRRLAQIK